MWNRSELKQRAKNIFMGNYWPTVGYILVASLIMGAGNGVNFLIPALGGIVGTLLVVNPMTVAINRFLLNNREGNADFDNLGWPYKNNFGNIVLTMFLSHLFIALWSMLLVVPGIVKAYEYRMIPFFLADDPTVDNTEAFRRSKEMMTGNKWKAFVLDLSFIGWFLLTGLTFGILAIFWTNPYYLQTCTELYVALKQENGMPMSYEQATSNANPVVEPTVDTTATEASAQEKTGAQDTAGQTTQAAPAQETPAYEEPSAFDNIEGESYNFDTNFGNDGSTGV